MLQSKSQLLTTGGAWLLLSLSACGQTANSGGSDGGNLDGGIDLSPPTVLSSTPIDGTNGVPLNSSATATFSEAMNRATLNAATFTLSLGTPPVLVPGTVVYANQTAVFWPASQLVSSKLYTATVSTGSQNTFGVALAAPYVWKFTTGTTKAPGLPVKLGLAGTFVILAKSRISTVPNSNVTGNLGISPAAASYITGFSLSADPSNVFSLSQQVSGKVYAANFAPPTPANLTTAVGDMETAFSDAAARAPDFTELAAGNIGGMTLVPGVYKWSSSLQIPSSVTLNGSATDVWILQVAQDLNMSSGTNILLTGGALPKNVFWQVSGAVTLGTTAHCEGVILSKTAVALQTGSSLKGKLLAQTAVTLDASTLVDSGQ